MSQQPLPPFSCSYTREVPDLLRQLRCSLALTTYQAGKVLLLSPAGENITQLSRNFDKPMGMALDGGRMAVASKSEVVVLENAPAVGATYPKKPNHYDAFFVPRASFYTGLLDLHDMAWGGDTLWCVNTLFSSLCNIGLTYSFNSVWQPPFITAHTPEDRCHLNGMTLQGGHPAYVTALGATDASKAWREDRMGGGIILHVPTNEIVLSGLPMPHSPRLYQGKLYFTLAATGAFCVADLEAGTYDVINKVPGFARGLSFCGDYAFVAHSRLRKKHLFGDLPLVDTPHHAGIVVIHLPSGHIAGALRYHSSCEEIYDVHVLENTLRPGILGVMDSTHRQALHTPEGSYWAKPEDIDLQGALS